MKTTASFQLIRHPVYPVAKLLPGAQLLLILLFGNVLSHQMPEKGNYYNSFYVI